MSTQEQPSSSSSVESSSDEIVRPPRRKILPFRTTRGRAVSVEEYGEEDEAVKEFWGDEIWEEPEDSEWSTENEDDYKDQFDSDFASLSSSDSEPVREPLEDGRKKKPRLDYTQVAKKRAAREAKNAGKVWSVIERERLGLLVETPSKGRPAKKAPKAPRRGSRAKGISGPPRSTNPASWTQEDHMAEVANTEKLNLLRQTQWVDKMGEEEHAKKSDKHARKLEGTLELWVSWSSNRKIDAEEQKKTKQQIEEEAARPPVERQLILYLPTLPDTTIKLPYQEHGFPPPIRSYKYEDPITHAQYESISEFHEIRRGLRDHELSQLKPLVPELPAGDATTT